MNQIYKLNAEIMKYYQSLLKKKGKEAKAFLSEIDIDEEIIDCFNLGYSGTDSNGLVYHFNALGFDDDLIIESGLADFDEANGIEDVFHNRLIIPLIDDENNVIGFSGRALDNETPIYLNSRKSLVFDKNKSFFGLNRAKDSRAGYLILCEGFFDVISLHQAGFDMAIANLGTKLTKDQANILKKYTDKVYVCYDTDNVGIKAATNAVEVLENVGVKGQIIDLSPYKDPQEFVKNEGAKAFERLLKKQ